MAKGGRRIGAGRPKGAISKSTRAIIEAAEAGGETPLEYMLRVMRDENADEGRRDHMAASAAPYVHHRLATTELTGKDGQPLVQPTINVQLSEPGSAPAPKAGNGAHLNGH